MAIILPNQMLPAVSRRVKRTLGRFVLLFFLSASLLMGSGRLGSLDSSDQLQAAFYAAHHGQFGAVVPPGGMVHSTVQGKPAYIPVHFWWQAPNKLYYQTHDIGNVALFTPIAFAVSRISKAPAEQQIDDPPLVSKLIISLLFSSFGGITAFLIFKILILFVRPRAAFALSALFLPTTFLWPFCKTVWDVAPGAMFATLFMYFCARVLIEEKAVRLRQIFAAGFSIGLCATFRYSFAAFLVMAFTLTLISVYSRLRGLHYATAAGALLVGLLPAFISNQVRMGAFWHPATMIPRYVDMGLSLNGNFPQGFFGLTVSPNYGLFIYCPIFLLIFALPAVWKRMTLPMRQLSCIFLLPALLYICIIAKMPLWSGFIGWGPRYLVLLLSFFYIPAGFVTVFLWDNAASRFRVQPVRLSLIALFVLVALNNLPPALVNWPLALAEGEKSHGSYTTGFYPQRAVWRGFALGIQGKPILMRASLQSDPKIAANAQFPDLWLARLFQKHGKTAIAGALILAILLGTALFSSAKIFGILREASKNAP